MQIWMQLMQWIHHMTPWVAVGMAALESLFPPIPLTAVVAANVAAFGAGFGSAVPSAARSSFLQCAPSRDCPPYRAFSGKTR